jgi:hypothetical protein
MFDSARELTFEGSSPCTSTDWAITRRDFAPAAGSPAGAAVASALAAPPALTGAEAGTPVQAALKAMAATRNVPNQILRFHVDIRRFLLLGWTYWKNGWAVVIDRAMATMI